MNQSSEDIKAHIKELVCSLFKAENSKDRNAAKSILAEDYTPIVRASGIADESREKTLEKIENPSASRYRDVDKDRIEVVLFQDDRMAIAKSLVLLFNDAAKNPPPIGHYQNMHVFLKRNDRWQCVAWQVTKVDEQAKK